MRLCLLVMLACASVVLAGDTNGLDLVESSSWPQWRGSLATGFAPGADPPVTWGEGKNVRWKIELPGQGHSSPIVVEQKGRPQVIVSGTTRVRGYDLATGDVVWECGGLSHNVVASPVSSAGMVYAGSSYEKQAMIAVRLDTAKGDVTGSESVAWTLDRFTPYVPSPLLYGDNLYFLNHYQSMLTCLDAKSGKAHYTNVWLPGVYNVYASLVGAAGRVYICDLNGSTVVIQHGPALEVLAGNHLEDSFSASPALAGKELFLRGRRYLYCIAEE